MTLAHFVTHSICHQDIFLKKIKCISGTPGTKLFPLVATIEFSLPPSPTFILRHLYHPCLLWAARWTAQNMAPVMLFCKWNRKGDSNNQWFSICFPVPPLFFWPHAQRLFLQIHTGRVSPYCCHFPPYLGRNDRHYQRMCFYVLSVVRHKCSVRLHYTVIFRVSLQSHVRDPQPCGAFWDEEDIFNLRFAVCYLMEALRHLTS